MTSTRRYNLLRGILAVLVLVSLVAGGWYGFTKFHFEPTGVDIEKALSSSTDPKEVEIRVLSVGKVYWGGKTDDLSRAQNNRSAYPFSGLSSFGRQNYDAWIGSLDCPIVDNYTPSNQQQQTGSLSCMPDYVAEASKWFTAFSIAPTHVGDQSIAGVSSTRTSLQKSGVQYFGDPDAQEITNTCEPVSLPARFRQSDNSFKATSFPIALCGVSGGVTSVNASLSAEIASYARKMPVWVFGYSASDIDSKPSDAQKTLYQSLIDAGADMVLGSGSGQIQPAEAYKGKLIAYSLGNFIHGEPGSGAAVSFIAAISIDQSSTLWSRLDCKSYKDDCFKYGVDQGLYKSKISYTYSVIASESTGDGVARLASDAGQQSMLKTLNWDAVLAALQPK